jgi:hypothetical protein
LVDEELAAPVNHLGWYAWRVWESDEAVLPLTPRADEPIVVGGGNQPRVLFYVTDFPPNSSGGMHTTDTVDFISVMAGEIVLTQDGAGEVVMRAGDVAVQEGGRHAWCTTGSGCRVSFVMVEGRRTG